MVKKKSFQGTRHFPGSSYMTIILGSNSQPVGNVSMVAIGLPQNIKMLFVWSRHSQRLEQNSLVRQEKNLRFGTPVFILYKSETKGDLNNAE